MSLREKNMPKTFTAQFTIRNLTFAFAFCLLFVCSSMISFAQDDTTRSETRRRGRNNYGRIELSTSPAGYPVLINGQPAGETTEAVRFIELEPGTYDVEIRFPNDALWRRTITLAANRRECIALNYRPRSINIPRSPCPYPVNISSPVTVNDGDIITFASDIAYTGTPSSLNYVWTVSPASARIVSGAGTPSITVDTTGMGARRVTAILMVDDGSGDRNCRQTAQAATNILAPPAPRLEPRRFDEFPSISFDDDKARLDNLAIELQNNPQARGQITVYGGQRSRAGQADYLATRARDYLVVTRGIDASRIIIVNGGYRERDTYEIYLIPQGADAVLPTPTVAPEDARPAPTAPRTRRSRRR